MARRPRGKLFFGCNSVDNALQKPFAGTRRRPEFLAALRDPGVLDMLDDYPELAARQMQRQP